MENLDAFIRAIADGFNRSQTAVIAGVSTVVGLIVLAILTRRLLLLRERRALRHRLEEKYAQLTRKLNLTVPELDLLDRLVIHLEDPSKKYLLLTNAQTLAACVRAFRKTASIPAELMSDLERHLGFEIADVPKPRSSTRMLSLGTVVRIRVSGTDTRLSGTVSAQLPDSIAILLEDPLGALQPGDKVDLYAGDFRGFIAFPTVVAFAKDYELRLAHSDRVAGMINLEKPIPVRLRILVRSDESGAEGVPTVAVSLDSRGARILNPNRQFREGDDLRLYFSRAKNSWRQVNAEVVSLESRRRIMRVRFSHVKRNVWEDIVGLRPSGGSK